jgi:membrane protease YdiL (CAAX protease family)
VKRKETLVTNFWTLFWILLTAGLFTIIAVLPYSLAINPDAAEKLKAKLAAKGSKIPAMLVIVFASVVQAGLLIAIAIYFGLQTTRAIGLRLPILDAFLAGQPGLPVLFSALPITLLTGLGVGAVIIGLEKYYFQPHLPEAFHDVKAKQATWMRLLACFYGGIYEELLLRLFVMSGMIWLIGLVWLSPIGHINLQVFWAANIISSLLFGLGHLPATARIARLTPLIIARALILNGLAGLLFGVLFFYYGLEFAMIAHFFMDIMMHVVLPEIMPSNENKLQVQGE